MHAPLKNAIPVLLKHKNCVLQIICIPTHKLNHLPSTHLILFPSHLNFFFFKQVYDNASFVISTSKMIAIL